MNKYAAEKIALEYYNLGIQHALGHTKQAGITAEAVKNLLKGGTRKGINLGTGVGLGTTGLGLAFEGTNQLVRGFIPRFIRGEAQMGQPGADKFLNLLTKNILPKNEYLNLAPESVLYGISALGGAGLGIHAAKKLNLGKKLVG